MNITFYGVRGSTPTHGEEYLRYGGNSSCIFVKSTDGSPYLFDAGSGIRKAGRDILKNENNKMENNKSGNTISSKKIKLFLSHHHWDHILGFPFFDPIYTRGYEISVYSGAKDGLRRRKMSWEESIKKELDVSVKSKSINSELRRIFEGQFDKREGYFPVSLDELAADVSFHDLHSNDTVNSPLTVHHFLHDAHPGGMSTYRVEENGKSFVYTGDYESDFQKYDVKFGVIDKKLISFARNADVLIMDGQYTLKEYEQKKGFGHSSYTKVCEIAADAQVKKLIITHHDPSHTDDILDAMEFDAKNYMNLILGKDISVVFAREGMKVAL